MFILHYQRQIGHNQEITEEYLGESDEMDFRSN